jgi:hypothetical protein
LASSAFAEAVFVTQAVLPPTWWPATELSACKAAASICFCKLVMLAAQQLRLRVLS